LAAKRIIRSFLICNNRIWQQKILNLEGITNKTANDLRNYIRVDMFSLSDAMYNKLRWKQLSLVSGNQEVVDEQTL